MSVSSTTFQMTDIEGFYLCRGGGYSGTVAIRFLGEDYAVHWNIRGEIHVGVGIRLENTLAVTVHIPLTLVVLYEIHPDNRTLRGRYSGFPAGGSVEEEDLIFSCGLKGDWEVGDHLLANYTPDPFWYSAKISEIETAPDEENHRYLVRFDDGYEEWLGVSRMVEDHLTTGDLVYQHRGMSHDEDEPTADDDERPPSLEPTTARRITLPSRIRSRDGNELTLQDADGGVYRTSIDWVRTIAPRENPTVAATASNDGV